CNATAGVYSWLFEGRGGSGERRVPPARRISRLSGAAPDAAVAPRPIQGGPVAGLAAQSNVGIPGRLLSAVRAAVVARVVFAPALGTCIGLLCELCVFSLRLCVEFQSIPPKRAKKRRKTRKGMGAKETSDEC